MAPRQRALQNLFLILTVLPCCSSLQVSISQKKYEIARGGDVTLTCSFTPARPDLDVYVIKWEASPDNVGEPLKTVATEFASKVPDIAPAYEGRATMETEIVQRVSMLTLKKVTLQDSRSYQCSVAIPNDDEGTTAATTSLLVLVAPSTPICGIQGTAEYFQDVTLTCMSEEGSPTPTYDWKSFSVESAPRPFPPKTVEKDGALSLFNITKETSGFFTCTSTNRIASAHCNFTLAVMPPTNNTMATIGIVVGVVAAILLLAGLGYFFYKKKSKKNAPKQRSAAEMEFHDTHVSEGGEQYTDNKSASDMKQPKTYTDKDIVPQKKPAVGGKLDKNDHSDGSDDESGDGKDSNTDPQVYKDDRRDQYRGSRDRLDDQRDQYRGSRDRLDDQRDQYRGSRDRLDDQRDQYRGSRDRLDDQRDQYRGSRDRLDDHREPHSGSRDRHGGSRDRLDESRDRYDRGPVRHDYQFHSSRDDYSDRGGGGGHSSSSHGHSYDYD